MVRESDVTISDKHIWNSSTKCFAKSNPDGTTKLWQSATCVNSNTCHLTIAVVYWKCEIYQGNGIHKGKYSKLYFHCIIYSLWCNSSFSTYLL